MSENLDYREWMRANVPQFPQGLCAPLTQNMQDEFPELTRVRGHFYCAAGHEHPHWWLTTPDGSIVDPTVAQFAGCGRGWYVEHEGPEPTGKCPNCGEYIYDGGTVCSDICASAYAAYCLGG